MDDKLLELGTDVRFKYMPLTGTIVAYNTKPGLFGGSRFPYMVHRSDGTLKACSEEDFTVRVLETERMPAPVKEEVPNDIAK